MADETQSPNEEIRASIKSSILEAIQANIKREKLGMERLGNVATTLASLNDVDMYGKNTPGDGYAKNTTQLEALDRVSLPADILDIKLKKPG